MNIKRVTVVSFLLGILVSLVSGLYTQDLSKGAGARITGYGFPLSWLEQITIVSPGSPSSYSLPWYGLGLLIDTVIWSIVIRVFYALYHKFTHV